MEFNVASLLKESTGALREFDIDDDVRIDGETHHLRGRARFDRTHDGVLVRANLHGDGAADCARCLRPIEYPIDLIIEEEYLPMVDVMTGALVEPPEGQDDAYRIDNRHMIDLTESIEQYWAMSVPMAPVCRDDCQGLCPVCGNDREAEGHACTREQVDARWAKLQNLQLG